MRVTIEKLDNYGRGICFVDEKICFVENALIGEVVDIEIVSIKKKYVLARAVNYIEKSNDRVNSICDNYSKCGGCMLMHMNYELENNFKKQKVMDLLCKFTDLDSSLVKNCVSSNELYYRNKITLHVNDGKLGLYTSLTHSIIPIEKCFLVNEKINKLINYLKVFVSDKNIQEIVIKLGNITKEVMVSIAGECYDYFNLLELVDVLVINDQAVSKKCTITSIIGDKKYLVSSKSFFQVNEFLTKSLYDEVYEAVKKNNSKNVLDLYCGTGTIGIYVSDIVNKVVGIEELKEAIIDADKNKNLNNCSNVSFITGKSEDVIDSVGVNFDTIIVDPPRSGLDVNVIVNIFKIKPDTVIYVSCDPATLMRDLKLFENEYDIEFIKPFNMFPKTHHVETVSVLHRKVSKNN